MVRGCWTALVLASCLAACAQASLNPCAVTQPTDVKRDGAFTIGIAYWPGGTLDKWGNATQGPHPCYDADGMLDAGVVISAFEVKVDTMTVLRTSRQIESELFKQASPTKVAGAVETSAMGQVVGTTVCIVRNDLCLLSVGVYRSEPTFVWSAEPSITGGEGVVDTLALISDFDKGKLKSLQWVNIGCGLCAGECVQTQEDGRLACASSLPSNCTCNLAANPGNCTNAYDNLGLCHTGFQVGASGTDVDSQVFRSGVQIQRMRDAALVALYSTASKIKNFGSTVTGFFGR